MKTITCIRFEDSQGIGFIKSKQFNVEALLSECWNNHFSPKLFYSNRKRFFPVPHKDKNLNLYNQSKNWFCAFKNLQQVKRIFTKEDLNILVNNGISIYFLEIEEYQEGRRQILYTKESIVNKVDISNKFK